MALALALAMSFAMALVVPATFRLRQQRQRHVAMSTVLMDSHAYAAHGRARLGAASATGCVQHSDAVPPISSCVAGVPRQRHAKATSLQSNSN